MYYLLQVVRLQTHSRLDKLTIKQQAHCHIKDFK